jgi:hypothetical protein
MIQNNYADQANGHILATLQNYFQKMGVPFEKGIKEVKREVSKGLELIPFQNSVMGVKPLGNGVAQIHFFTLGGHKDLLDDIQFFYKQLKSMGIHVIYDRVPDRTVMDGLQMLGAHVEKSDKSKYMIKATL